MSLSAANFEYLRGVIRERSGHQLGDDKLYLVENRLSALARRLNYATVDEMVHRLRGGGVPDLLPRVLEAMTINETSFFRDERTYDALRATVLPGLIQRRSAERCLAIWSAACSSGQEPYSLAILLRDGWGGLPGWTVRIVGTDLSPAMLERGRRGWYSELEMGRGMPEAMRGRFFRPSDGGWQIADEVRQMVEWLPINLVEGWPAFPRLDLILIRNVLIYFDTPTRQRILSQARRLLRPDGYLLMGGAETTVHLETGLRPVTVGSAVFFQPEG